MCVPNGKYKGRESDSDRKRDSRRDRKKKSETIIEGSIKEPV